MTFVLDASIVLAIAFEERDAARVKSVLIAAEPERALVPGIWATEVANALLIGERRKRITEADISWFLEQLAELPIETDVEGAIAAFDRALPLARRLHLTAYDALYLELAQRKGIPLATLDKKLATAAAKLSIELILA